MTILTCQDFINAGFYPADVCCSSCHYDHEDYGYPLCETGRPDFPNRRWTEEQTIAQTCCAINPGELTRSQWAMVLIAYRKRVRSVE